MKSSGSTFDVIVTVASWEPRFVLGMERTLRKSRARKILCYFIGEYAERTEMARQELRRIANEHSGIELREEEMTFSTPGTWSMLERDLGPSTRLAGPVLVDLTTMPREIIWSTLFWLEAGRTEAHYVYSRPSEYANDWLARDPNKPRLVYKLAGTLKIGQPTALVAVTGFDERRCRQAVEYYEPSKVVLATQTGGQFENDTRNIGPEFKASGIRIDHMEVDVFGTDHGYATLRDPVGELAKDHNVILCSFGPKPSAIALYRLQREFPHCALAYIGCKEYNPEYSNGLSDSVHGSIRWR